MDPSKSNSPSVIGIMDFVAENISIVPSSKDSLNCSQFNFELHVKLESSDIIVANSTSLRNVVFSG